MVGTGGGAADGGWCMMKVDVADLLLRPSRDLLRCEERVDRRPLRRSSCTVMIVGGCKNPWLGLYIADDDG